MCRGGVARPSIGACHVLDPGSNPGPGAKKYRVIKMDYIIRELLRDLRAEVVGQFIADAVNRRFNTKVTSYDLIVLGFLYGKGYIEKESLCEDVEKYTGTISICELFIENLLKNGLIIEEDGSISITPDGERIIEYALRVFREVKRRVLSDSFFGWVYRELNYDE